MRDDMNSLVTFCHRSIDASEHACGQRRTKSREKDKTNTKKGGSKEPKNKLASEATLN